MERKLELTVDARLSGAQIKTLMSRELKMSRTLITNLKNCFGAVLLNGKPVPVISRVKTGDTLCFIITEERKSGVIPSAGVVNIMYEDEDVLVVLKPGGLLCHPVHEITENTLSNYLAEHYLRLGKVFVPRIITRLDKGTSGLVLFAKNPLAGGILSSAAACGQLKKEYLAITTGTPPKARGVIDAPLCREDGSAIKRQVCCPGEGQSALTRYELLESGGGISLLRVWPETGRTHQIRAHLAYIGCPLVGDFLYGREDELIQRPALHMAELSFIHPVTGEQLSFSAPLPEDMKALLEKKIG